MPTLQDHRVSRTIVIFFGLLLSIFCETVLPASQTNVVSPERSIRLNVLVTDSKNHAVADAKQEEFHILEDGVSQTITYFSKDDLPLNYCLVVDTSGSVKKLSSPMINAAQAIVRSNRGADETSLIEFKDQPELIAEFSSKEEILKSLESLRGAASRQSAIIDAVYLATKYVAEHKAMNPLSRRVLIVISDCNDNDSYYKLDDLRKLLRNQIIQIFVLGYGVNEIGKTLEGGKQKLRRANEFISTITKETGGLAYFPQSEIELREAAIQLSNALHTQYVIGYVPSRESKAGSYHKVTVSVDDAPGGDKRVALTREGYVAH